MAETYTQVELETAQRLGITPEQVRAQPTSGYASWGDYVRSIKGELAQPSAAFAPSPAPVMPRELAPGELAKAPITQADTARIMEHWVPPEVAKEIATTVNPEIWRGANEWQAWNMAREILTGYDRTHGTAYTMPTPVTGGAEAPFGALTPAQKALAGLPLSEAEAQQQKFQQAIEKTPPPTPQEEAEWTTEAYKAKVEDVQGYIQERWLADRGLTAEHIAYAKKIMPGVTRFEGGVVVAEAPRAELAGKAYEAAKTEAAAEVEKAKSLTDAEENRWKQEATKAGYSGNDAEAYVKYRWLMTRGLAPLQLALAGKLMAGVTEQVGGVVMPVDVTPEMGFIYEQAYMDAVGEWHTVKAVYEDWQNKIKSGEILQSNTGDYISKENYDSLSYAGKQAWMMGGFVALSDAERYISGYAVDGGYDLAKLAYDAEKKNDQKLLESAYILLGENAVNKAKGITRPSGAWWYQDPVSGTRLVNDEERSAILGEKGWDSPYFERFSRSVEGTQALVVRARYDIGDWKKGEIPEKVDVAYLDRIASPDFYDKGGTSKEAIALDNAMRVAGFDFPSGSGRVDFRNLSPEDKGKVVAAWGASGPIEGFLAEKVVGPTSKGLESIQEWAKRQPTAPKIPASVLAGASNVLVAVAVVIPSTLLSAVERATTGQPKSASAMAAELPLGMLQWAAVDSVMRIREDPIYGSGVLFGEIFGIPIVKGLVKIAVRTPMVLAGRRLAVTSIEYTPDVVRAGVRPGMAERYGQAAIQQVVDVLNKESPSITKLYASDGHSALAIKLGNRLTVIEMLPKTKMTPQQTATYLNEAWKGKIPNALVVYSPDVQVAMTEALTGNVVTQSTGGLGGAIGLQTAWQRIFPQTGFHATGDLSPFEKALAEKGHYLVEPKARPVEFMSPQFPEAFRLRGLTEAENSGGVAHFFSANDLQPLPSDLLGDAMNPGIPFQDLQTELLRRAELPTSDSQHLPQGIYPVFKHYTPKGGVPTYELEFVATPGFKWNALPPSWFMPKDMPTASIKVPSAISYKDPITGVEIKGGQPYKMLFVASDNAIKEGVKAPTLAKLQAVWALDKTIYAINRLLAPKEIRRMAEGGELAATESTGIKALKLLKPDVIKAEVIAKELAKKYQGKEGGFTNEQLAELGEWLDGKGKWLRTRDRYFHPDAESVHPTHGWVSSRVTVILRDPKTGDVFGFRESATPDVISLPGGQVDVLGIPRIPREIGEMTPEIAAREQIISEVGVDITNIRRMPIYYGKVTEHAMPGSPVFEAEPTSLNFDPSVGKEVIEVVRLRSGGTGTITLGTYEILKSLPDFDVSNYRVKDMGWSQSYLKWREPNYAKRVDWTQVKSQSPTIVPKEQQVTAPVKRPIEKPSIVEGKPRAVAKGEVPAEEEMLPYRPKEELPYAPIALGEPTVEPTVGELRVREVAVIEPKIGEPVIGEVIVTEPIPTETEPVPTELVPTEMPPTEMPPTEMPPTEMPPTEMPPTEMPPTEMPPTEMPPTEMPPTEMPPTPPLLPKSKEYEEQVAKILPGSICWVQGRPLAKGGTFAPMYKILPPPYRQEDFFTMREVPPGYKETGISGKGSARRTLQVIGGIPPADVRDIDLGWARINIRRTGAGSVDIEYAQDEEANVGTREQTIGMGKGQIPIDVWKEAKAQGISKSELVSSSPSAANLEGEVASEIPQTERQELGGIVVQKDIGEGTVKVDYSRTDLEAEAKGIQPLVPFEKQMIQQDMTLLRGETILPASQRLLPESETAKKAISERIMAGLDPDKPFLVVEPYKVDGQYNLVAAIKGGVPETQLVVLFGNQPVQQAKQYSDELNKLEAYKSDGGYNLVEAIKGGIPNQSIALLFGEDVARQASGGYYQPMPQPEPQPLEGLGALVESSTYNLAIADVEPYRSEAGYDLLGAIYDDIPRDTLVTVFGEEAYNQAESEYNRLSAMQPSGVMDKGLVYSFRDVTSPQGRNTLLKQAAAEASGGGQAQRERRKKKPKNIKDWWDNEFYENYSPPVDTSGMGARYYRGRRLLPPNLEGNI